MFASPQGRGHYHALVRTSSLGLTAQILQKGINKRWRVGQGCSWHIHSRSELHFLEWERTSLPVLLPPLFSPELKVLTLGWEALSEWSKCWRPTPHRNVEAHGPSNVSHPYSSSQTPLSLRTLVQDEKSALPQHGPGFSGKCQRFCLPILAYGWGTEHRVALSCVLAFRGFPATHLCIGELTPAEGQS